MRILTCAALCCLSVVLTETVRAEPAAEDGFVPLFNGQDLTGWDGDPELWKVEDGCIVGSTDTKKIKRNSFLSTLKTYGDFVLRLQFKLRNHNSGVQVRSRQHPNWVVKGYQPDIAERRFIGILYEEGGRGILADVKPAEVAKHVKRGEWNEYVITCRGPKITIELNGFRTVDYTEKKADAPTEGIIAFQLHAGPAMQIRFKDIAIKELR